MPSNMTMLPELLALGLTDEAGRPRVEALPLEPGQSVPLPPLAFGTQAFDTRPVVEHPNPGAWRETAYDTPPTVAYRLRGAHVHSSAGVVVLEGYLVAETLLHVNMAEHAMSQDPVTGTVTLHTQGVVPVGRAVHLLAGGASNYYHWHLDILARLSVLPEAWAADRLLVPPLDQRFQREALVLLAGEGTLTVQAVAPGTTLWVEDLLLIPDLTGAGRFPRPCLLGVFDRLRAAVAPEPPHRRLYISRIDSRKRVLRDEAALAARLAEAGYEVLSLGTLSLAEQIQAFAEATHVIGAHGAGLTNLLFCSPGTRVCELQMDCYLNWLFRRLAALRGLSYGCVLGSLEGPWDPQWPHDNAWSLPQTPLWQTLAEAGFLACPPAEGPWEGGGWGGPASPAYLFCFPSP